MGHPAVSISFPPLSSLTLALMKGSVYFVLASNSTTRGKKTPKNCRCGPFATPTQKCRTVKIKKYVEGELNDAQLFLQR